jgi:hypothetical protein
MRTARRAALVVALAGPSLALVAVPAQAASISPPVVKTAWFWAEKSVSAQGETLPTLPEQADAASGVPAGALGVSYTADQVGGADKVASIGFDLSTIPVGSPFTSFRVTVPMDPGATPVQAEPAAISACENIDSFLDSAGPQAISAAPPVSLASCVPGVYVAGKGYTFDLTQMANDWSFGAPSEGISLRPTLLDTTSMKPFSVAVAGKNAILTTVTAGLPAQGDPAPQTPVVDAVDTVDPVIPAIAPPPALTGGGGVIQAPLTAGGVAPAPQIVPALPAPQTNPQPATVPSAYRAAALPRDLRPATAFWWGLLGVGVLLALGWLVQSDPMAPSAVDPRRRRFAQVVRSSTPSAS